MERIGSPGEEAWHEAGHGLMAHLLGGTLDALTLESDEELFEGRATIAWPPAPASEAARRSALTALAGPLGELIFRGDVDLEDPDLVRAWDGDWQEVERCAAVVQPDPDLRTDLIQRWIHEVENTLRSPRNEEILARIADALDAHGTLDGTLFEQCL